jgi:phosphoglycolate phosphatase
MRNTIVFDLDGTLVDSVPDLAAALTRMAAARGWPPFALPDVAGMVGDGAAALVRRAMDARGAIATEADVSAFVADYTAHVADATVAFPGVADTLAALAGQGWRIAVCTNKPEAPSRLLLATLGLDRWIAAVGGGDSFPSRKPDPAHLLATVAAAGGEPTHAVMVGDHRNDVLAATGAAMPCIFAAWGYGTAEMAQGAAVVAAAVAQVPAEAARLLAPAAAPATA